MGQTLTHGIYLPDEGERNCYDGLAANWQLLDGAVGTVAEHTSQIAGKAPLVHTHTKADITDFPVYGTTAGTICEGNDSRLSDARTPVAHTHVTADVTDLLNTAHEWSKSQTYSDGNAIIIKNNNVEIGNEPSAYKEQRVVFADKNGTSIASIKSENQVSSGNVFVNGLEFVVVDKFKEGVRDPTGTTVTNVLRIGLWNDGTKFIYNEGRWRTSHIPFVNNAIDLGSSSNQWRSVYAQSYYYNGIAWGLDKANVWSADQTYSAAIYGQMIWLKNTGLDLSVNGNTGLSDTYQHMIHWTDKNNAVYSSIQSWTASSENTLVLRSKYRTDANTVRDLSVRFTSTATNKVVYPETNADTDLGTSTNKWKSFNGINPGALSLPDINTSIAVDTTNWVYDGATFNEIKINNATQTISGWLYIIINNASSDDVIVVRHAGSSSDNLTYAQYKSGLSYVSLVSPIMPGVKTYVASRKAFSTIKIYSCLGNV